ncbi:MAG: hypothetical protein HZB26_06450 [Candidatus Hydrogenedentes bacterium]|nr:hypothetical protein [Candidatus Hydrogenedentota bacterium]
MKQIAYFTLLTIFGNAFLASAFAQAANAAQQPGAKDSAPPAQTAPSPATIDIQQFEVLKLDTVTLEKLVVSQDVLTFKNSDIRIKMGASAELVKGVDPWPYYHAYYTDSESLNVSWLIKDKILRATWQTFACGTGIYDTQVDVLVLVKGAKGTEILRQEFTITARSSSQEHTHTSVTFSAKEEGRGPNRATVFRSVEVEDVFVELNASVPVPLGDDSHRQMSVVREVTRYELCADGSLVEDVNTRAYIDLSEKYVNVEGAEVNMYKKDISLDELSDFLVLYVNPRFGSHRGKGVSMPEERKRMVGELKNLNHGISDKPFCTGKIEIPHRGILFSPLKPGQAPAG